MNDKLTLYLDGLFAPYDGVKSIDELKSDLLSDLQERFQELRSEGKDDETAFTMTVNSIGDIGQTVQEMANLSRSLERQVKVNLNAIDLQGNDFVGVIAHNAKFEASVLAKADFTNADLTGSIFKSSNVSRATLEGANLTDCNFTTCDLAGAIFNKSTLVRTIFNISGLEDTRFSNIKLIDVKFIKTDLRKTVFTNCAFTGVDFNYCDMRDLSFEGKTFSGVKFEKTSLAGTSFKGATLKNVSFTVPFSLTNSAYLVMKTVSFDGAMMDKLTYAGLKGLRVIDLSKVTII